MMLCDISVVFNSFADAFGLMNLNSVGRRSAQLAIRAYGSAPWLLTHSGQAAEVKQKPSNGPASSKTSMIGAPVQPIPLGNRWRDSGASNRQLPLACRDPSSEPRHGESPKHAIRMIGRSNSSRHAWRVFVALTGNTIMRQT